MAERVNVSFFQELMNSVAEQSRALLPKALFGAGGGESIEVLSRALMSGRGEASGVAIARQLLIQLKKATSDERLQFFRFLADELQPDAAVVAEMARAYLDHPSDKSSRPPSEGGLQPAHGILQASEPGAGRDGRHRGAESRSRSQHKIG